MTRWLAWALAKPLVLGYIFFSLTAPDSQKGSGETQCKNLLLIKSPNLEMFENSHSIVRFHISVVYGWNSVASVY